MTAKKTSTLGCLLAILFLYAFSGYATAKQDLQEVNLHNVTINQDAGVILSDGELTWDGHRFVLDEGTTIKTAQLTLGLRVGDRVFETLCNIDSHIRIRGMTVLICRNGGKLYQVGSPDGVTFGRKYSIGIRANPWTLHVASSSPIQPGIFAPYIQRRDEILANAIDDLAMSGNKSNDKTVWAVPGTAAGEAVWAAWRVAVDLSVAELIQTMQSGEVNSRVAAAERLGFICHPDIVPALRAIIDSKETPSELRQAATTAIIRAGK